MPTRSRRLCSELSSETFKHLTKQNAELRAQLAHSAHIRRRLYAQGRAAYLRMQRLQEERRALFKHEHRALLEQTRQRIAAILRKRLRMRNTPPEIARAAYHEAVAVADAALMHCQMIRMSDLLADKRDEDIASGRAADRPRTLLLQLPADAPPRRTTITLPAAATKVVNAAV